MIEYPPLYQRLVWDFKIASPNSIRHATNQVSWDFLFSDKDVHCQVHIFNTTLINIFSNFIPNKLVTFDHRDSSWMTEHLKEKTKWPNNICKEYLKNSKRKSDYLRVQSTISDVSNAVFKRKEDYHNHLAIKLNDPRTTFKPF